MSTELKLNLEIFFGDISSNCFASKDIGSLISETDEYIKDITIHCSIRCIMSLNKTELKSALETIFCDVSSSCSASNKAEALANAIDEYVKTALVNCSIPAGSVIVQVTGGSGTPAVGVPNATPILLTGDPDASPGTDNEGGLS